jgi:hypothetical protein
VPIGLLGVLIFKNPSGGLLFRGALPQAGFAVHDRQFLTKPLLTSPRLRASACWARANGAYA